MALLLAVLGALGYGTASTLQTVGARQGGGALRVMATPAYLAGLLLDGLAWAASLAALRTLPVYEVQAILAASLTVTALTARLFLGYRLRRIDTIAIGLTMAALMVLAAGSGEQAQAALPAGAKLGVLVAAILIGGAGLLTARAVLPGMSAILAGLAFGGAAVCARCLTLPPHPGTDLLAAASTLAGDPLVWSLVVFAVAGMLLNASALEQGQVGPVTALLWISEVAPPSIIGVVLLHDSVRAGWVPPIVVALVIAVSAIAVLALSPAQGPTPVTADR